MKGRKLMKKVICDYCGSKTENLKEYIIPNREPIYIRDRNNALLFKFGYKTIDTKRDVCIECQNKIAFLMNLLPKMQIKNGNAATMEITIGG